MLIRRILRNSVAVAATLAATGCGGAPPESPESTRTATPSTVTSAVPEPELSLAPLGTFGYTNRGRAVERGMPLGSVLHVYELACTRDEVANTWGCHAAPGAMDRAIAGTAGAVVSDVPLPRARQCFHVDVPRANPAITAAITAAYDQRGTDTSRSAATATLDARAAKEGPTLYVIEMKMHDGSVACHCQGRDCCLGFHPTAAQARAGTWSSQVWVRPSQPIAVPATSLQSAGTAAIYDASPRAREIVALGQRGAWTEATALALREAASIEHATTRQRSLAQANVMVAAFEARDLKALESARVAVDAFGNDADPMARSLATLLGDAARGKVWLDDDPCSAIP